MEDMLDDAIGNYPDSDSDEEEKENEETVPDNPKKRQRENEQDEKLLRCENQHCTMLTQGI